jgi:polysaccharide deacetylase 2 family uncharacterized protein YibQ
MLLSGCRKPGQQPLGSAQVHALTRQFIAAASSAAPSGSVIRAELRAANNAGSGDRLDIAIHAGGNETLRPKEIAKLLQSLGAVATAHGLVQDPPSESHDELLLQYRHAGVVTQAIHIHSQATPSPPPAAMGNHETKNTGQARLAIILDDLGEDRAAADEIFALPYPLTISVLPHHPHSVDIAKDAHARGYQVMLHLPMQSIGMEQHEAEELRPGMPAQNVSALVGRFLEDVPDVMGVNNHQGSQATADRQLMSQLMPILRERHLFYVDSRTTTATLAYQIAQHLGVPSAFRNVPFLDDVAEVAAVHRQLDLALRGAHEKGAVIAIGHAHPATLQALREVLPTASARGVRLVFASELVH